MLVKLNFTEKNALIYQWLGGLKKDERNELYLLVYLKSSLLVFENSSVCFPPHSTYNQDTSDLPQDTNQKNRKGSDLP